MPREFNPLIEKPLIDGNFQIDWPLRTGRQIFDSRTISGLNRIPVIIHSSYIVGNAQMPDDAEPPVPLDELTEALIVDGTVIILQPEEDEKDTDPKFLTNIIEASRSRVVQVLEEKNTEGLVITRVWTRDGEKWLREDFIHFGEDGQSKIDEGKIAKDRLFIFPNGIGILAEVQDTIHRLEEIRLKVRKGSNEAVVMVISGFTGDMQQAAEAVADPDKSKLFTPQNTAVDFMNTTAAVDQFLSDGKDLMPLYWKQVRLIEVGDQSDISGVARRLIMQPMLQYITGNQKKIVKIYADLGFKMTFGTIPTTTVQERRDELALLKELRDSAAITPEVFTKKAEKLV